jgi:hypothetical protein
MNPLGVIKNTLGKRGLARIDVGADADVAQFGQLAAHCLILRVPELAQWSPSADDLAEVASRLAAGSFPGSCACRSNASIACFKKRKTGTKHVPVQKLLLLTNSVRKGKA